VALLAKDGGKKKHTKKWRKGGVLLNSPLASLKFVYVYVYVLSKLPTFS
jgi:hypothetical protein